MRAIQTEVEEEGRASAPFQMKVEVRSAASSDFHLNLDIIQPPRGVEEGRKTDCQQLSSDVLPILTLDEPQEGSSRVACGSARLAGTVDSPAQGRSPLGIPPEYAKSIFRGKPLCAPLLCYGRRSATPRHKPPPTS